MNFFKEPGLMDILSNLSCDEHRDGVIK